MLWFWCTIFSPSLICDNFRCSLKSIKTRYTAQLDWGGEREICQYLKASKIDNMHSLIEYACVHPNVSCAAWELAKLNNKIHLWTHASHTHTLFDIDFEYYSLHFTATVEKSPQILNKTGIFVPSSDRERALMIDENGKKWLVYIHSFTLYE